MMGMNVDPDVPVVGIVTRLVGHKGVDLMKEVLEKSLLSAIFNTLFLAAVNGNMKTISAISTISTLTRLVLLSALCLTLQERFMQEQIYSLCQARASLADFRKWLHFAMAHCLSFVKQAALRTLSPTAATDRATALHSNIRRIRYARRYLQRC